MTEESEFQDLVLRVFNNNVKNDTYAIRSELFNQLMEYFPDHMAQPRENLTDFVPPIWICDIRRQFRRKICQQFISTSEMLQKTLRLYDISRVGKDIIISIN